MSLTKTKPCALAGDDNVKMLKPTKGYDAHISRAKAAAFDDIEMAWEKSQVCCNMNSIGIGSLQILGGQAHFQRSVARVYMGKRV